MQFKLQTNPFRHNNITPLRATIVLMVPGDLEQRSIHIERRQTRVLNWPAGRKRMKLSILYIAVVGVILFWWLKNGKPQRKI